MQVRRIFEDTRLQFLAASVYRAMVNGDPDAIYKLSRYLADHGLRADIMGTRVIATAAVTRAKHPEQIIFDLRGGDPYGIGGVANIVHVSTYSVAYYLDREASEELAQQEERHVAANRPKPSDRTEAEDTMLRE